MSDELSIDDDAVNTKNPMRGDSIDNDAGADDTKQSTADGNAAEKIVVAGGFACVVVFLAIVAVMLSMLSVSSHPRRAASRCLHRLVACLGSRGRSAGWLTDDRHRSLAQGFEDVSGDNVAEDRLSTLDMDNRACLSEPCMNDGHCVRTGELGEGYECRCPPCASGTNCETLSTDPGCGDKQFAAFSDTTFNTSRESYISRLKDHLLAQYDPHARPVTNLREPTVAVTINIAMFTVSAVDPVAGSWEASIWLRATWTDPYLTWDPAEWGGITELDFHPDRGELWVPDISFYNQRENVVFSDKAAYVYSSGYIFYSRPALVKLQCTQDLAAFPFDTQKCAFHIGSWNDHGHEIRFHPGGIDMSSGWTPNQVRNVPPSLPFLNLTTKNDALPR